jgi:chromosome partitioning protein
MLGVAPEAGLAEVVTGEATFEDAAIEARERLWLLAGGRELAGVKRLIDRKDFSGEKTLGDALQPLEKRFDYLICDTSPGWDALTVNVLSP